MVELKKRTKAYWLALICIEVISFLLGANSAFAAVMTNSYVSISDPRPSQATITYTISWKAASNYTAKCIKYDFDTSLASSALPTGMSTASADKGTFTNLTAANWTVDNTGSATGIVLLTYATGAALTSGTQYTTPITTITNPSSAVVFWLRINTYTNTDCATGGSDSVVVAAATTSAVTVTATVNQSFTFSLAGISAGNLIKGAYNADTGCSDSATAVTFPTTMTSGTDYTCGQALTVTSNGAGGYTVYTRGTAAADDLINTGNASYTITDATGTNGSPAAWGTPTEGFGYTTSDGVLGTATTTRFAADNTWAKFTNSNLEIAYNSGPTSETTNIGYRVRFSAVTEEGIYQGTVLYTAVPIF